LALGNPIISEPLPSLQFSEQEVKAITSLYGTNALTGSAATETAVRTQAADKSILHLAVHGEYNLYNPLFSTLYLASDSTNDGRLEVNEIYELDLTKSTNLVVLSACQTQIGSISAGDEIVSLNRAFIYSGTPTVIASLWNVDDKATAILMEKFYANLKAEMGKAEALQQAQIDTRKQYPNPYYWASFVLTGDPGKVASPKPIPSSKPSWPIQIPCTFGLILALPAVWMLIKKKFVTDNGLSKGSFRSPAHRSSTAPLADLPRRRPRSHPTM
jgi:CHAT domain-containing protein